MENTTEHTPMREIEIFGIPALFTGRDIPSDDIPIGLYHYRLLNAGDPESLIGTVLTPVPVEIPESGERDVYKADLMLDVEGDTLTPEAFAEKYFSPVDGPDLDERYGKAD